MRGWMNDERVMITCCSDGTRPVIFKIQRMDYKAVYVAGINCDSCRERIKEALSGISEVTDVVFREELDEEYLEVYLDKDVSDDLITDTVQKCGEYQVTRID